MSDEIRSLINFRLDEAEAGLKEAGILADQALYRGALNRCYYALFYATLALLATKNLSASKHSGVISLFNREFVKTGTFPKELAETLTTAFDLRNKTDYRDFVYASAEDAHPLIEKAALFVAKVKELVTS